MRTLTITLLLFSIVYAKPCKKELKACEGALSVCLASKEIVSDTIYIYEGKDAIKVIKQAEKTKRKANVQNTKVIKIENKTEKTEEKNKTKRNFVFQFFGWLNGLNKVVALLVLSGGTLASFLAEKLKPFTRLGLIK